MAFIEMPPVGLRGHIMSNSGRLTGIGMHGTLLLTEHPESLRPGFFWVVPFRLDADPFESRCISGAGEEEEAVETVEDEETCLCVGGSFCDSSLIVTDLADLDMAGTCSWRTKSSSYYTIRERNCSVQIM